MIYILVQPGWYNHLVRGTTCFSCGLFFAFVEGPFTVVISHFSDPGPELEFFYNTNGLPTQPFSFGLPCYEEAVLFIYISRGSI